MKSLLSAGLFIVGLLVRLNAAESSGGLDLSSFGTRADLSKVQITSKLSPAIFKGLPKELPVYQSVSTNLITPGSIRWLIAHFLSTEKGLSSDLKLPDSFHDLGETVLFDDGSIRLIIDPRNSWVHFKRMLPTQRMRELTTTASQPELISKETFTKDATEVLKRFGINANELGRKPNGAPNLFFSDIQRMPRGATNLVVVSRTATFKRQLSGLTVLGEMPSELKIGRLADGTCHEMLFRWPSFQASAESRRCPNSNDILIRTLTTSPVYWDHSNEFDPSEVGKLSIVGVRVAYALVSSEPRLIPVLLLDVENLEKRTTVDTVVIVPILGEPLLR